MNSHKRLELSRLLSRLDRLNPDETLPAPEDYRAIGKAFRIGITGPLGVGKSTLINEITHQYRSQDKSVGILAVDPSSPFTGGALLGDRVRMYDLTLDEGTFIRSLATRGASGGLTASAIDAADILDAYSFERIIIETVGVGQAEVDIVGACDVTVVVLEPGSGDSIQAMKAGLMEIADLFVVNKKDLKGANRFIMDLQSILEMQSHDNRADVLATSANHSEGILELVEWLEDYFQHAASDNSLQERRAGQRIERIKRAAEMGIKRQLWQKIKPDDIAKYAEKGLPVRETARQLIELFIKGCD
ncbi:MAG: methylmalonyl Co-A mutase-associated GTPase MeaB [Calditrichaeota bacterium]|nr:methylmalonyl Co-A mutase-associated GTPase MeaB [Calditrichota bacterium]